MNKLKPAITGVVMAGGNSSRMGTDKGLLHYRGKPLIQYAIDALKPQCSEIIISTQNQEYSQFGLPLVHDEIPDCGPIGGIYSVLKTSLTDYILVLACDMPFVSSETIQILMSEVEDFDCVVPRVNGMFEPLCGVYSKLLIKKIEERLKTGHYSLYGLIVESNCRFVDFKEDIPDFRNFNTSNDLI
jgi:molybdenum cofactor guanylyltransferase